MTEAQTPSGPPAEATPPRSPLGYPQYRELWSANAASNFGSQIQLVGAGWLMSSLTSSPQLIALVQTANNLATVLFILAGGAMADNYDRRRIMLTTQIAMLLTASALAVLTWRGLVAPWSLLLLIFAISGLGSFNNPAWQASIRDILPRDMISRAVALNSTSINLARTAGPALGGVIVAFAGVAAAFVVNALSFVGFLVALLRWRPIAVTRAHPRERILPAMAAGVRYVSLAPHVRNAAIRGGLSGLSASAIFGLLPVVARHGFGGNATLYGLLLAAFGSGAVGSALIGAWLRARITPDQVTRIAAAELTFGLAILAVAPFAWVAAIGAALGGAGWTLAHSTYNTTVQLSAPRWVTARSLALYQTATFAGMALGGVLFGWVAEYRTFGTALLVASAVQALAGLIGLRLPLPRYQDLRVNPLLSNRTPELDGDVGADEGPIHVEVLYRIAPEDTPAFLTAMVERGRIRRRDGARDWAVWQDLSNRSCWIEGYRVASWAEYLRHNARRTLADRDNFETLLALNGDPAGPFVRRYVRRRT